MAFGTPDGRVIIEIDGDDKKLKQALREATNAIDHESGKWEKAGTSATNSISSSFSGMFSKIAAGAAFVKISQMLSSLASESINLASDLEEVQNVVDTTFGDDNNVIEEWAKNAAKQFGLTETQAKRFASTLGAMLKSAGVSSDEITKISTDLAGLAADMASFYNLDFETAFQKIRSGISGETEPLKQLGINLSESNLKAFAEQTGQLYNQMTEAERVVLRYQYLMNATADAQGDFERTSGGFANQMRLLDTNLTQIKTNIGNALIPIATQALQLINGLLSAINGTGEISLAQSFSNMFSEIDADTERKMANIRETATSARDLVNVLQELGGTTVSTPEGEKTYEEIFQKIGEITKAGGDVEGYISGLGLSVEETTRDYNVWIQTMERLQGEMPGTTSMLDTQTGAIEGGTDALMDYIDAWQKAEEQAAVQNAFARKANALEQQEAALADVKTDYLVALAEFDRLQSEADEYLRTHENLAGWEYIDDLNDARDSVEELGTAYETAAAEHKILSDQLKRGQELFDAQAAAAEDYFDKIAKDAPPAIEAATKALQDMYDYMAKAREDTASEIRGIVHGFEMMETPAEKARKKVQDLKDTITAENKAEIDIKIANEESTIPTIENMTAALQDQVKYMEEYQANLAKARAAGVSESLLAELSDGSLESADYLSALALAADRGQWWAIDQLNEAYQDANDSKDAFTDSLTESKLVADDAFKSLAQTAADSIAELDQYSAADTAMQNTVQGIADGIASRIPVVQAQINALNEVLAQLGSMNLGVGWTGAGISIGGSGGGWRVDGSNANGLDYVPFDGYLSILHEGESILTAEEARVWRNFKAGGASGRNSIDYGALSGAIWDNAPKMGGGNVYLDGRTVGRVISSSQADSYRTLERSGWQG